MENKKSGFVKGCFLGVVGTLLGVFIAISAVVVLNYNTVAAFVNAYSSMDENNDNAEYGIAKLKYIFQILDMYYLDEYDKNKVIDDMLAGAVNSLGDPYSVYYSAEQYKSFIESSQGVYYGIGVVVQKDFETGDILVVKPYENCPGAIAGMKVGDRIRMINGEDITEIDLNEAVLKIRGEEGTTVTISVLHEGDEELTDLVVTRSKIELPTVSHTILEDNIGYVLIEEFDEVTTGQFLEALTDLKNNDVKDVIFDLRDNPGGSLETTIDMLDLLLPKGIYTYLEDKNGNRENYKGVNNPVFDFNIVILVNENSASASELFTGAMKDYKKATIVGTTTFGKGIVQQTFSMKDGSGIKITMARYHTPNGVCIHKTGIKPDYEVSLDEGEYAATVTIEEDEQLQKAIELLKMGH